MLDAFDVWDFGRVDTAAEHVIDDWDLPGFDLGRDTFVVEADGALVAYALVVDRVDGWFVEGWGVVHPEHMGRGLGTALVERTEERAVAARRLPVALRHFVSARDAGAHELFLGRGYSAVRRYRHLQRSLGTEGAAAIPVGTQIRPFRAGDERAAHAALEEAFAEHWGYEPMPFDVWRDVTIGSPRFRPELLLLALDGAEVVGVLLEQDTEDAGWIAELGVRPAWRGRGIATALLRTAFAALAARGYGEVRLNVDVGNESGALALYERVGMFVRREWHVFERTLG